MVCPRCKNAGFKPSDDISKPLVNLGNKQHYATFNTRRYSCVQCGYLFMTKEDFYRDIEVRSEQKELFKNAH